MPNKKCAAFQVTRMSLLKYSWPLGIFSILNIFLNLFLISITFTVKPSDGSQCFKHLLNRIKLSSNQQTLKIFLGVTKNTTLFKAWWKICVVMKEHKLKSFIVQLFEEKKLLEKKLSSTTSFIYGGLLKEIK